MSKQQPTVGKLSKISNTISRLWLSRRQYTYLRDWLYSIYHRVLIYFPHLPLPARNRVRAVWLANMSEPFYVRMGTTDWYVLEEIFMDRVYDPVIKRLAQDIRNVVDLGANTGFSTRLWQQTYPSARIIAVEPDAANVEMWRRNIVSETEAIEPMLIQACVAGSTRLVALDRSGGSWRFSMQDIDHANGESVCAMTLTQILAKCGMDGPIDLLKCDIEGAESEVFANCTAWVNRVQSLVIELHSPYTSNHFLEDLGRAGKHFELYHRISCNGHSDLLFLEQVG